MKHQTPFTSLVNFVWIFQYYVHSPNEVPDISSSYFLVFGRMDRDTSFTVLETTVSPEINRLNPSQRKCRFEDEPTAPHLKVYSFNLCRMQCRKQLAVELCGCAPYFYQKEREFKFVFHSFLSILRWLFVIRRIWSLFLCILDSDIQVFKKWYLRGTLMQLY